MLEKIEDSLIDVSQITGLMQFSTEKSATSYVSIEYYEDIWIPNSRYKKLKAQLDFIDFDLSDVRLDRKRIFSINPNQILAIEPKVLWLKKFKGPIAFDPDINHDVMLLLERKIKLGSI